MDTVVDNTPLALPTDGVNAQEVLQHLQALKAHDIPWQTGKVLAYVYEPSPEAKQLVKDAYSLFLSENGLDPTAFPSLLKLEKDVVRMAATLLGGDEQATGNFTSGGTESIILAVKTARDRARAYKPHIQKPQLILPETAHAAFHKAGHYLGVEVVMVPVNKETFKVDAAVMEAAINENTILLVGSAPNYPFGVVDPIEDLATLAKKHDILLHVDCCVGGMYLPFAKGLGYEVPNFDFKVDGVTSISCDFHKYGYAAKGASCILYKNNDLRRFQIFTCADWSGYTIVNPTVLSSKTGGPVAGAWAILNHLGKKGYEEIVTGSQEATIELINAINDIPELEVLGNPVMNLIAIKSVNEAISVFDIADMMQDNGWHLQVQLASNAAPETIHLNINRANLKHIPQLVIELKETIAKLKQQDETESFDFDPAMFDAMLSNPSAETFDQLEMMLGFGGDGVPDKLGMINKILNKLPAQHRNMLLTEFMNRLFTA